MCPSGESCIKRKGIGRASVDSFDVPPIRMPTEHEVKAKRLEAERQAKDALVKLEHAKELEKQAVQAEKRLKEQEARKMAEEARKKAEEVRKAQEELRKQQRELEQARRAM